MLFLLGRGTSVHHAPGERLRHPVVRFKLLRADVSVHKMGFLIHRSTLQVSVTTLACALADICAGAH